MGLARALLRDAPILMLDEPVSAQDQERSRAISPRISSLCRRDGTPVTVLASSHNISLFEGFNHALVCACSAHAAAARAGPLLSADARAHARSPTTQVLANRRLAEAGPVGELMKRRGLFYQLINDQVGVTVDSSGRAKLDTEKLRSIWLFADAPLLALQKLAPLFTTRKHAAGEVLFAAGDVLDTVFLVVSGRVNLVKPSSSDAPAEGEKLATLEAGGVLMEQALLEDLGAEHSAVAESQATTLSLPRVHFETVLETVPALREAVQEVVADRKAAVSPSGLRAAWPLCKVPEAALAALEGFFRTRTVPERIALFDREHGSPISELHIIIRGARRRGVSTACAPSGSGEHAQPREEFPVFQLDLRRIPHWPGTGHVEITEEILTPTADRRIRHARKMAREGCSRSPSRRRSLPGPNSHCLSLPRLPAAALPQEVFGRGSIIGEAVLVHAEDEAANPTLVAALTAERCVICSLDVAAFERAMARQPEMRRVVEEALAAWRSAVQPRVLSSYWLMAPLAAAAAAPADAAAASGRTSQAQSRASTATALLDPIAQLTACCTTRVLSEGAPVFGPDDPLGAVFVVSGLVVEKTETVRARPEALCREVLSTGFGTLGRHAWGSASSL